MRAGQRRVWCWPGHLRSHTVSACSATVPLSKMKGLERGVLRLWPPLTLQTTPKPEEFSTAAPSRAFSREVGTDGFLWTWFSDAACDGRRERSAVPFKRSVRLAGPGPPLRCLASIHIPAPLWAGAAPAGNTHMPTRTSDTHPVTL